MKLFVKYRYNMGVRYKRSYGSSTMVVYDVYPSEAPADHFIIEVAGKGPHERLALAKKAAAEVAAKGDYKGKTFKIFPKRVPQN